MNSSPSNDDDDILASTTPLSENVSLLKSQLDALEQCWGGQPLWEYGQPWQHYQHELHWFAKFLSSDKSQ